METRKITEDLLLSSKNKDWMRKVLISSHVISDKFLDIYSNKDRNYFEGDKFNYVELEQGCLAQPDVITIIDRIISVFVIGHEKGPRNKRKVLTILGHDSNIKEVTKRQLNKIIMKSNDYSFLQDSEFKILYFPFCEQTEDSPNNYEFYIFREIGRNRYLVNSLSNNLSDKDLIIREGFSKKELLDMVIDSAWDDDEDGEDK